jgi:hypothetical protein
MHENEINVIPSITFKLNKQIHKFFLNKRNNKKYQFFKLNHAIFI